MRDTEKDYYTMWLEDAQTVTRTMVQNLIDDLTTGGYHAVGPNITHQISTLHTYIESKRFFDQMLQRWSDQERIQQWCYNDLITRGVIE